MNRESKFPLILDVVFFLLALCGFSINLFLLVRRFSDGAAGIAGCGGGGCEEILASKWSVVFGVPVTAFGMLVYTALMVYPAVRFRRTHHWMFGILAGAAAWFTFVQAVILKSFCPWCMAAHCLGLAVVVVGISRWKVTSGVFSGRGKTAAVFLTTLLGIGLAQLYGPVPPTHRIFGVSAVSPSLPVESPGVGRTVVFDDGRKSYQVATLPRLGKENATHVLVEVFDYQCSACQVMAGYVDALVKRHPAEIAVILLPMPLEQPFNRFVSAENQHPGSYETARIALAVWLSKPEAFDDFHQALIADPSPASARTLALAIVTEDQLRTALSNPWIEEQLRKNVSDWHDFSKSTDKLPKLLIRDRRILHGLPSGEQDFIRVMEQELGL